MMNKTDATIIETDLFRIKDNTIFVHLLCEYARTSSRHAENQLRVANSSPKLKRVDGRNNNNYYYRHNIVVWCQNRIY